MLTAWLILAQPASVAATAYSALVFETTWTPINGIFGALCIQAGEVDTNRDYGQVQSRYYNGGNNCSGSGQTVGTNDIAVVADGYGPNGYCGSSGYYYNSSPTWGWQLWITLCSNPPGIQSFYTVSYGKGYVGYPTYNWWDSQDWVFTGAVVGPAQNY